MSYTTKSGLSLLAMTLVLGCSTAPPDTDDLPVPTAPQVSTTSQAGPGPTDPDAPEDFTATPSGLKYRILREGSGASPTASDRVRCHYRGWLDDGTEFDSSYGGPPAEFSLQRVVDGWKEGIPLVSEGGMIELEIPAELGYGQQGDRGIPGGATLHFIVELIEIL